MSQEENVDVPTVEEGPTMDELLRTRYYQTEEEKEVFNNWLKKQTFATPLDKEVFDNLPLSNVEKMLIIESMRSSQS